MKLPSLKGLSKRNPYKFFISLVMLLLGFSYVIAATPPTPIIKNCLDNVILPLPQDWPAISGSFRDCNRIVYRIEGDNFQLLMVFLKRLPPLNNYGPRTVDNQNCMALLQQAETNNLDQPLACMMKTYLARAKETKLVIEKSKNSNGIYASLTDKKASQKLTNAVKILNNKTIAYFSLLSKDSNDNVLQNMLLILDGAEVKSNI